MKSTDQNEKKPLNDQDKVCVHVSKQVRFGSRVYGCRQKCGFHVGSLLGFRHASLNFILEFGQFNGDMT